MAPFSDQGRLTATEIRKSGRSLNVEEILLLINQPLFLWSLFGGAVALVLIDYIFPVDWPAYFGYALFGIFIGATAPLPPAWSLFAMLAVFSLMLTLHKAVFSKFFTNAPSLERRRNVALANSKNVDLTEGMDSAELNSIASREGN